MEDLKRKKYVHTSRKRFDPIAFLVGTSLLSYLIYVITGGADLSVFWDLKSLMIVAGGTVASLIIQYDFASCWHCVLDVVQSFRGRPEKKMLETLSQLDHAIVNQIDITELREANEITGEILNDCVYMVKQYLSFEEIDEFITARVQDLFFRRKTSVVILQRASVLAPSLGLFGTVIGLVILLKSLSDPTLIGPSMSLALLTTAYGSGLSSLVISPLAGRVEQSNEQFVETHRQLLSKVAILIKRFERGIEKGKLGRVA
ncbi:MAG: MotA/TolQ/ExbB proton channel family protein [Oligoflexales bacterium]|nr:MotA/TolQ/ExbB proton channel family protein [Oligoflexales bacterium]